MLAVYGFGDRYPKYPERVGISAPRGFREQAKQVAKEQGVTFAEFVRSAVADKIAAAKEPKR